MAQHRKKPARRNECRRNQWWIRARRGPPSEPRHTRAAGAVRRVIVTPTFAAGLGVVVAALLAFQMGVPSFRVSVPRWTGQRCTTPGCQHQPGQSGPAAVPGGQPLTAPAPAASTSPGPGSADAASQSAPPVVSYQTDRSWPGGFRGHLTFSFTGRGAPGRWWLRFVYPSGRIQRVWGRGQVAAARGPRRGRGGATPSAARAADRPGLVSGHRARGTAERLLVQPRGLPLPEQVAGGQPPGPRRLAGTGRGAPISPRAVPLAGDLARFDARGADVQPPGGATHLRVYHLDVRVPAARGAAV
jgi:hypothetical protein